MKKQLFFAITVIIIYICAFDACAQTRAFDCARDSSISQGSALLEKVQSSYKSVGSLKADFNQQSYLAALDISEGSSGKLYFERPGKIKWDYTKPEPQTFLLNNESVYLYQPNEKQLVIDQMKEVLLSEIPVAFIMGVGKLSEEFTIKSFCTNSDGNVLTLNPKKTESQVTELALLIDPSTNYPKGGKVTDQSGNVTSIVFENSQANAKLDSKTFEPNFPTGIDVNDRRPKS
jgi:outer membrane lipoprotein carrier protein